MKRFVKVLLAVLVALPALGLSPLPTAAAPNPLTCAGYPEARVFLESQAWWMKPGEMSPGRHVHLGTCFPHAQAIRGVVSFDVRVILQAQPAGAVAYKLRLTTESQELVDIPINVRPDSTGHGEGWYRISINTRVIPEGRREFRFSAFVTQPDAGGNRQFQSTGWLALVDNTSAYGSHYRLGWTIEARGWYTGTGYAAARLNLLPPPTVSGIWAFNARMVAGAGGQPVTSFSAHVDPNFHAGDHGRIIRNGAGSFAGTLRIDTRTLSNGVHRLVLLAHNRGTSPPGRNSAVLVVPFTVSN